MICTKCGKRIKKTLIKCPFCGERIINQDNFDLPVLKPVQDEEEITFIEAGDFDLSDNNYEIEVKDEYEENTDNEDFDKFDGIDEDLLVGETRRIVLDESSLIDDINRQIEEMGRSLLEEDDTEDKDELEDNLLEETNLEDSNDLSTKASLNKRRKIFIISILSMVILLVVGISLYNVYISNDKNNSKIPVDKKEDMETKIDEYLEQYYVDLKIDDLVDYVSIYKNDKDTLDKIELIISNKCSKWVSDYLELEIDNKSDYEANYNRIKKVIDNINVYGTLKNDNNEVIKLLVDEKYNELSNLINDAYDDMYLFFEAIDQYNQKEYNKAYMALDKIDNNSRYYNKVVKEKNKIVNNILSLLKNDIDKLKDNIDSLNDNDKLNRYIQIQEIIFEYNNIYYAINLSKNNEYQELLEEYNNYIESYSNSISTNKEEVSTISNVEEQVEIVEEN